MAIKQSTKERVKQVAQKLFRERGYAAVGMRELAKEVVIQAPSLYNHYKSKDDLLREICFDMAKHFFEAFDKAVSIEEKFPRKLKAIIKAHIGVIASNLEASEVFFNEWMFLEQPHLGKFKKMRFEYEMKFREVIDKGIKKGDFKKMNSKLIAFAIFSALNATYELYNSNEKLSTEQIAEDISDLLLKGLKA
jgi:AcrR family transcriptional regulator